MAPKKGRKLPAEMTSSRSFVLVGEEARTRVRFLSLLLDFEDLRKETESKKKHLQEADQKKVKLLAEVKFLRKKYKDLSENPSGKIIRYGQKKRLNIIPSQLIHNGQVLKFVIPECGSVPFEHTCSIAGEDNAPSPSSKTDLNQDSLQPCRQFIAEETELCVTWGPLEMNNLKYSRKRKFEVNKVGSRKIKGQDQYLLHKMVK